MKRSYKIIFLLHFVALIFFNTPALAWNAMGHRVIGEIAYQHLTPETKEKADQLINYLSNAYPYSSTFQTANSWADMIKQNDIHAFDSWHFYDKPYSTDKTATPTAIPFPNLLWSLEQSFEVLKSTHSNQYEKALFLRFFLHFVGDAHQPLHCITRYSQKFQEGDKGGNLFLLTDKDNLHSAWDNGLGILDQKCGFTRLKSKSRQAKCLADKFQQDYPPAYFKTKITDLDFNHWLNDSYVLGISAYNTPENQALSETYIKSNQIIAEQQMTLAGYRLAALLNSLEANLTA